MSNCGKIRSFKVWQIVISNCVTAEIKLNSSATSFFTFVLSNLVVNSNHIFCFCFPTFTGFFSFFFFFYPDFSSLYFSLFLSVSLCLSLSASISNLVFVFSFCVFSSFASWFWYSVFCFLWLSCVSYFFIIFIVSFLLSLLLW